MDQVLRISENLNCVGWICQVPISNLVISHVLVLRMAKNVHRFITHLPAIALFIKPFVWLRRFMIDVALALPSSSLITNNTDLVKL